MKVRKAGRIAPVSATISVVVNDQGHREVLGMAISTSEVETPFGLTSCTRLRGAG